MINDIIFCVNSILPVFVLIGLGYLLKRINLTNDGFLSVADKLVFKCALPVSLFYNVATTDFTKAFNGKLTAFVIISVGSIFLVSMLIFTPILKKKDIRGAVIQGIFRSNVAILGIPLAENLIGVEGSAGISFLISFVIPVYNLLAVIALVLNMPSDSRENGLKVFFRIIKNIVTNPLIISIVLAIPFSLGYLKLFPVLDRSVSYLADLSTPLALISLGGTFKFSDIRANIKYSLFAAFAKSAVLPAIMCTVAALFGFRGTELGLILIVFGTPTAVSSYIMAKQMKSNYVVASQIIVISTLMSCFTLILGSFVLKTLGLF